MNVQEFQDEKLYFLCKKYGEIALKYRHKFAGLLPEVYRRHLYEKKGFSSIFEFAKKLGGMSEEQVRRVLNLEKRFEEKGVHILKEMLVSGEVSVNKLARVGQVVNKENQFFWATQAKLLPKAALETLVRDHFAAHQNQTIKTEAVKHDFGPNGLFEPTNDRKSVPGHGTILMNQLSKLVQLDLSPEIIDELLNLKVKGIDLNALITKLLQKRKMDIENAKDKLANTDAVRAPKSEHIPSAVRKVLKQEHGEKCSIAHCKKPAKTIHHTQRWALSHNHDPHFLAPLCADHHKIAHSIDVKVQKWRGAG